MKRKKPTKKALTEKELTDECWRIHAEACDRIMRLVKDAGYTVFYDDHYFHRYVKYGETSGILTDAKDLMHAITCETRDKHDRLVFATEENIEAERRKIYEEEISRCDSDVKRAKDEILKSEEKRRNLIECGGWEEYDRRFFRKERGDGVARAGAARL